VLLYTICREIDEKTTVTGSQVSLSIITVAFSNIHKQRGTISFILV